VGWLFTKKWKFFPFWGRIPTPGTDWHEILHGQVDLLQRFTLDIHVQSRPAAAAIPSLVTHCRWVSTGLQVFDLHASRPAICSYCGWMWRKNWEPRLKPRYNRIHVILKRAITSFWCMYLFHWKLLYIYKFSETSEGSDVFNVCWIS